MAERPKRKESAEARREAARARAAMVGAKREGAIAAGTLVVHFAWLGFQDEVWANVYPEAIKRFGDILIDAGVLSKADREKLCEENVFWESFRETVCNEPGSHVRKIVVDILSRSGGVRLPPNAAVRGRRLMERLDRDKPVFTEKECRRLEKALGAAAFSDGMPEARAALEKVVAAGATGQEALLPLANFVACIAKGVIFKAAFEDICLPAIRDYAYFADDDGYASRAQLTEFMDARNEVAAPLWEDIDRICAEAAARISDTLGWLIVDILSRADGLELSTAGASRALTLLGRLEADEKIFTDSEHSYVSVQVKGAPRCPEQLEDALQKIAGAKEVAGA